MTDDIGQSLLAPPWPIQVAVYCRRCDSSLGYRDPDDAEEFEESTRFGCTWCLEDCPVCGHFAHEDPERPAPVCAECIDMAREEMAADLAAPAQK